MPLPPLPLDPAGRLFFSATFLEMPCDQERAYYFLNQRVGAKTIALDFGSMLHLGLEMWYRQKEFNTPASEVLAKISRVLEVGFAKIELPDGDGRTLNRAQEILEHYVAKYENEQEKPLLFDQPFPCKQCQEAPTEPCEWCNNTRQTRLMSETSFAKHLFTYSAPDQEISIFFRGFIDLIVQTPEGLFTLDFKSGSQVAKSFWNALRLSSQQKGYVWVAQHLLGTAFGGYIIRALRTTDVPQYVRDGMLSRKGTSKTSEKWWDETLQEQKFYLFPDMLAEWEKNAKMVITNFLNSYFAGEFVRNFSCCERKNHTCAYAEVCSTFPIEAREMVLQSGLFKQKEKPKK